MEIGTYRKASIQKCRETSSTSVRWDPHIQTFPLQRESLGVGSAEKHRAARFGWLNINLHVRRNQVMRVHPRDNEEVNECWISDEIDSVTRVCPVWTDSPTPLIRKGDKWIEADWQDALMLPLRV